MMKNLTFLLFIILSFVNFANASGITPDQPINTFVHRSLVVPKIVNSPTAFLPFSDLMVEITPACSAFGASNAKVQLCAEFTNTIGNNLGEVRIDINSVRKSTPSSFSTDSFSDKGTQCYIWVVAGTALNCGIPNNIGAQFRGNLSFQKATITVDYQN